MYLYVLIKYEYNEYEYMAHTFYEYRYEYFKNVLVHEYASTKKPCLGMCINNYIKYYEY